MPDYFILEIDEKSGKVVEMRPASTVKDAREIYLMWGPHPDTSLKLAMDVTFMSQERQRA